MNVWLYDDDVRDLPTLCRSLFEIGVNPVPNKEVVQPEHEHRLPSLQGLPAVWGEVEHSGAEILPFLRRPSDASLVLLHTSNRCAELLYEVIDRNAPVVLYTGELKRAPDWAKKALQKRDGEEAEQTPRRWLADRGEVVTWLGVVVDHWRTKGCAADEFAWLVGRSLSSELRDLCHMARLAGTAAELQNYLVKPDEIRRQAPDCSEFFRRVGPPAVVVEKALGGRSQGIYSDLRGWAEQSQNVMAFAWALSGAERYGAGIRADPLRAMQEYDCLLTMLHL